MRGDNLELLIGVIFFIGGFLGLFPSWIKSIIHWDNTVQGVKTRITKWTVVINQIGAILALLAGLIIIMLSLSARTPDIEVSNPYGWEEPIRLPVNAQ